MNNLIKSFLLLFYFTMFLYKCGAESIVLVNPKVVIAFGESSFFCYGRNWDYDKSLKLKIKNDLLLFNFKGSIDDSIDLYTAPDENNEKPIFLNGKKYIIFKLNKVLSKHIYFNVEIVTNDFIKYKNKIDGFNKIDIIMPLPQKGNSINNFSVHFTGEKGIFGIKSIIIQ